jgi:CSLREA domain-containing protein
MRGLPRILSAGGPLGLVAVALLTLLPGSASAAYSGENGRIAFERSNGLNFHIYSINSDGSDETELTPDLAARAPAYSPDGERIAFLGPGTAGDFDIWVMNADGSDQRRLAATPDDRTSPPTWSPNGQRIAFENVTSTNHASIRIVDSDSGDLLDTITPAPAGGESSNSYLDAAWDPTSATRIAVLHNQFIPSGGSKNDLATISTGGGGPSYLTSDVFVTSERNADWAPDGGKLIFDNVDESADPNEGMSTVPAAGGAPTPVGRGVEPVYSPDGTRLAFGGLGADLGKIYTSPATTYSPQLLVSGANPSWQPVTETGLVVNTTEDGADSDTDDERCDSEPAAGDQCSLRAAIQEANARGGADEIGFDIDPGGRQTISPEKALPPIAEEVSIDGSTQPGAPEGEPGIMLDGSEIPAKRALLGRIGLLLKKSAGGSIIKMIAVGNFGVGLKVDAKATSIVGNWVGTFNATGTQLEPNGTGVLVTGSENKVGHGVLGTLSNMLSGNTIALMVKGAAAKHNLVTGNVIGPPPNLDPAAGLVSNEEAGVVLTDGASANTIGGETQAEGNVIGNSGVGVLVDDAGAGNAIISNAIGAPRAPGPGAEHFGNSGQGVLLRDTILKVGQQSLIRINTIAGNGLAGLEVKDSTGAGIFGNAFGTFHGLDCGIDSLINGAAAPAGKEHQIMLNLVQSLRKGTGAADGKRPAISNVLGLLGGVGPLFSGFGGNLVCGGDGDAAVSVSSNDKQATAEIVGNQIEGGSGVSFVKKITGALTGNTITGSSGPGVVLKNDALFEMLRNVIHDNAGRSIELLKGPGRSEPDQGDGDDGPNGLQNYPFLGAIQDQTAQIRAGISLLTEPSTKYRVEFFGAESCGPDGTGEAETFIAAATVKTKSSGQFSGILDVLGSAGSMDFISATITKLGKKPSTSEHSDCRAVAPPSEPAVGIAPESLVVKKDEVKVVVECLDSAPCTGEAAVVDRATDEEYGSVEISEPFSESKRVKIELNAAGIAELEDANRLITKMTTSLLTSSGLREAISNALLKPAGR